MSIYSEDEHTTTTDDNDSLIISVTEPYKNLIEILSYEDSTKNESENVFYDRFYRWGIDGETYSDWEELNNQNLKKIKLNPENDFWIEYKYDHNGYGKLSFEWISLDVVSVDGKIISKPKCIRNKEKNTSVDLEVKPNDKSLDPYNIKDAQNIYLGLSNNVSNIFGICCDFYKTEANQNSRDVQFYEYSLYNVIKKKEIKILFPDNELPTREAQFSSQMMIDFPVQFEIHIVKEPFKKSFGNESKPEIGDYLYVKRFLNKIYQIDGVSEADDFMYVGSYWRVSLIPYQDKNNINNSDINEEERIDNFASSLEKEFSEEYSDERFKVRKPNQYNTIGRQEDDYVRRILNKGLKILDEEYFIDYTKVLLHKYDLGSIKRKSNALTYRFNQWFNGSGSMTFWLKPNFSNIINKNWEILSIDNDNGLVKLNIKDLSVKNINVGDWIEIKRTGSYNGISKINNINEETGFITVNENYIDNVLENNPIIVHKDAEEFINYNVNNQIKFSVVISTSWIMFIINNKKYIWTLNKTLFENKWYAFVLNLNLLSNQLSLFCYTKESETDTDTSHSLNRDRSKQLVQIFSETKEIDENLNINNGGNWSLLGSKVYFSNFRIWKKPIEEEEHSLILTQFIVNDSDLTFLVDNASPQLKLTKIRQK